MRPALAHSWTTIAAAMLLCAAAWAEGRIEERKGIVFAEPEGASLGGTLYLPDDAWPRPRPAVVLLHGGGWLLGSRRPMTWYARQLAHHGYVAFSIDYRLMPKHPFPDALCDAKDAVRWLRAHHDEWGIDPARIGAMGESAGAHLAALLATTGDGAGPCDEGQAPASSAIQALVSVYGAVDLEQYRHEDGDGLVRKTLEAYVVEFARGDGGGDEAKALAAASAVHYVDGGACPALLVHGVEDRLVSVEQSRFFLDRLERAGVPVSLVQVPERGHAFDRFDHRRRAGVFSVTLEFLDMWLGGRDAGHCGEMGEK